MTESLVNADVVIDQLNDNHVFADVIHGIIVEPHVAGYPDDEKQIGIHSITPIQLKFASGQSLQGFLRANSAQGREAAYRIGEELVDFRPHIAERIASSGQYVDVTGMDVEQIALLAESELNARFALGMLFENDAFNDAFLGRDDVPELDARFSSQRLFEDGSTFFDAERNILVAFGPSDRYMPAHAIVAQMDFERLQELPGQFDTIEDAMPDSALFAESFPMLCVDETNRVGDALGWVAMKDKGFDGVTGMELNKFLEKYADKVQEAQRGEGAPERKFDEDKVWEEHLAAKEGEVPGIVYEGFFLDKGAVEKAFAEVRGEKPSFPIAPEDYHVTTEFAPSEVNSELYGKPVNVEITAYKSDDHLTDRNGNVIGNEGFAVKVSSPDPVVQGIIDNITESGKNWHITGSFSNCGDAVYTNNIDFTEDALSCSFKLDATFGGFSTDKKLLTEPCAAIPMAEKKAASKEDRTAEPKHESAFERMARKVSESLKHNEHVDDKAADDFLHEIDK